VVLGVMVQLENRRIMGTKELLKYVYYNIVAEFYFRVSSRFLSIATLLDHKAEVYVEKQKAILRKYQ
jgi:hypothetical protein